MLDAPPLDAAAQAKVKLDVATAKQKLASFEQRRFHRTIFLERAESYTAHTDGSAPTADEWRGARVILDQVLPAYYAAQKPAAPSKRRPAKRSTSRWYAGPTLETFPIQQVCWYRKWPRSIPEK